MTIVRALPTANHVGADRRSEPRVSLGDRLIENMTTTVEPTISWLGPFPFTTGTPGVVAVSDACGANQRQVCGTRACEGAA